MSKDIENNYDSKNIFYYYYLNTKFNTEMFRPSLNTSELFLHNECFCCRNYIVIHEKLQYQFIEKYNKYNSSPPVIEFDIQLSENTPPIHRPSSKYIKILFRLHPELFKHINLSHYKYIDRLKIQPYISNDHFAYMFETHFYQTNLEYIQCSTCRKKYCTMHFSVNKFFMSKCSMCPKYWCICPWCRYDHLYKNISFLDKLLDENLLCMSFHKAL